MVKKLIWTFSILGATAVAMVHLSTDATGAQLPFEAPMLSLHTHRHHSTSPAPLPLQTGAPIVQDSNIGGVPLSPLSKAMSGLVRTSSCPASPKGFSERYFQAIERKYTSPQQSPQRLSSPTMQKAGIKEANVTTHHSEMFEKGLIAFKQGQFLEATTQLLIPELMLGNDSMDAQALLLAMSEKVYYVRDDLRELIKSKSDGDITYKILAARLRLQAGEINALEVIESWQKYPYASYTLGLYYTGILGAGEINRDEALRMYQFSGMKGFQRGKEWAEALSKGKERPDLF